LSVRVTPDVALSVLAGEQFLDTRDLGLDDSLTQSEGANDGDMVHESAKTSSPSVSFTTEVKY
jgi:hypothetical protein